MPELTHMIRWNASFVRGLAERVLSRARVIRSSLGNYKVETSAPKGKRKRRAKPKRNG